MDNEGGQPEEQPETAIVAAAVEDDEVLEGEIDERIIERVIGKFFAGPLPSPESLQQFENVLPGAAREIVDMAKSEQEYRHRITQAVVKHEARGNAMGVVAGLIVALVALSIAYLLGRDGHTVAASIIAGIDLVGLVAVFVIGQKSVPHPPSPSPDASDVHSATGDGGLG